MHVIQMSVIDLEYPKSYVITQQCISLLFVIINLCVVIKEICKRRGVGGDIPKFKSRLSKWLSLLCIFGGLLHAFTAMMHYFDTFCIFMYSVSVYIGSALPICVGMYQLSRLYQCFAPENVSGGYPKWLFYAMGIFGILCLAAPIPFIVGDQRNVECGLTDNYNYHLVYRGWGYQTSIIYYAVCTVLYLIWDITTVSLFVLKLRTLTQSATDRTEPLVNGIHRNMTRVVVLTIFYLMTRAVAVGWYSFLQYTGYDAFWHWKAQYYTSNAFYLTTTTAMSFAVFLMQPHNPREYGLFLKRIICLRLHFLCCCFYRDMKNERDYFLPKYQAVYRVTASGVELERLLMQSNRENRATSGDAFNDFSMNDPPSTVAKYQPPDLSLRMETAVSFAGGIPWNDFLYETDSRAKGEFSSDFSFGVYLEYWRQKKHNYVRPKYSSLKEEVTMNRHSSISNKHYMKVKRECIELRADRSFIAKDIGMMNTVCGIMPGSEMTVEHMIAVKIYTNFTVQQGIFKRHCRRLYREETLESVIRRNKEIAHWCRLLRECVMFWGEPMSPSDVVYCGLNARLIFHSLHQRFECPLSTTKQIIVARGFAKGAIGIILTLKRSSPKTRYLNVAPFTKYKHEDERLFSGSTLKIIDVSIGLQSLKRYVDALRMLEQIANGYFIDYEEETAKLLLSQLRRVVDLSVTDALRKLTIGISLSRYLNDERYDTEALLDDVENVDDSNLAALVVDIHEFRDTVMQLVDETKGMSWSSPNVGTK